MAAATSAAVCARAGPARRCRRASLARRSPTDPTDHSVTTSTPYPVLAGGFEDDDRDLPGGLLLVVGESRVGGLVRCPDLVPLRAFGHAGMELHRLGADLGLHVRVGQQVVVPVRVGRSTGLGSE